MIRCVLQCIAAAAGVLALSCAEAAAPVTAVAVNPEGSTIVSGSTEGLDVCAVEDLAQSKVQTVQIATQLEYIADLAFSPDGQYVAAAGGVPGEAGVVEIYAWPQYRFVRRWDLAVDVVYAVDWSADSGSLAVAAFDGTAWQLACDPPDANNDRQWQPGHSSALTGICLLPFDRDARSPQLAVSAGIDQTLRVVDAEQGGPIRTLHNHTAPVHAVAVQPASPASLPVVASISDDRTVRFWQPTIGRMMRFVRLESIPLCMAWSTDGMRLVTGCADGSLRVVDPQTAAITATHRVAESPLLCLATIPRTSAVVVGSHAGGLRMIDVAATE